MELLKTVPGFAEAKGNLTDFANPPRPVHPPASRAEFAGHPLLDKHWAVEFGVIIAKVVRWASGFLSLLWHDKTLRGMAEHLGRSGFVATSKGTDFQAEVFEGHRFL